jgi:hypothetical protein
MTHKVWLWLLAGWLLSLVFSPTHVLGMFKGSKG